MKTLLTLDQTREILASNLNSYRLLMFLQYQMIEETLADNICKGCESDKEAHGSWMIDRNGVKPKDGFSPNGYCKECFNQLLFEEGSIPKDREFNDCFHCKGEFQRKTKWQKFCSTVCRNKNYYMRFDNRLCPKEHALLEMLLTLGILAYREISDKGGLTLVEYYFTDPTLQEDLVAGRLTD